MDYRLAVAILVLGTVLCVDSQNATSQPNTTQPHTTQSYAQRCHTYAKNICNRHIQESRIYCLSDGSKHTGYCAYYTYHCDHLTARVTGYTDQCVLPTHAPRTTPPPPGHFELTLEEAITHGIDDRLQASHDKGIDPKVAIKIFTKQDHTHKVYERNKDCWAYGLDLTCMSPWNSNLRNRKAGTLISPRHYIVARHYNIKNNSTIRFVDNNNNVVERRVVKSQAVSSEKAHLHGIFGQDIVVGVLDSDVPSTISFAKVMPHNLTTFRVNYQTHIPAMSTDQEEKALVDDFNYYSNLNIGLRVPQTHTLRRDFYESKISGDSGNPTFFIIDNELVLLFVFTTGGAGGGTNINHYFDEINQIMAKQGGGYQLTEVDLSKYLNAGETLPSLIGK